MTAENEQILNEIIRKCFETNEIDKRAKLIQYLNNILPTELRVQLPSLITNSAINKILYTLEEKVRSF
jgi:hypothetical protein